jgi:hypothetical protein
MHAGSAQRFLSAHAAIQNTFYVQRHLTSARTHRAFQGVGDADVARKPLLRRDESNVWGLLRLDSAT